MSTISEQIKSMVTKNKTVEFQFYRDHELWYKTECGFEFPVPTSDIGQGIFKAKDKALLFMRWIRWQLEDIEKTKKEFGIV